MAEKINFEEELEKFKEKCEGKGRCHQNFRNRLFSNMGMIEFAKYILRKYKEK